MRDICIPPVQTFALQLSLAHVAVTTPFLLSSTKDILYLSGVPFLVSIKISSSVYSLILHSSLRLVAPLKPLECRSTLLPSQLWFLEWGSSRPNKSLEREAEIEGNGIGRSVWFLPKQPNSPKFISKLVYEQKQNKARQDHLSSNHGSFTCTGNVTEEGCFNTNTRVYDHPLEKYT